MNFSRRDFLKTSIATAVTANGLSWFSAAEVFGADTVVIPSASHWGPFKAVVKNGVLIGIQPLSDIDALPTRMLIEGLISRVYHKTRVKYPMVRKSYLANPDGDSKPHLRGKEPFVRTAGMRLWPSAPTPFLPPPRSMATRPCSALHWLAGHMPVCCARRFCRAAYSARLVAIQ